MEQLKVRKTTRRGGALLLLLGLILGTFAMVAGPASAGDGNNGTVKISDHVADDAPSSNNDPQVSCPLVIEWFGFDGAASSTATITPHNKDDVLFTGSWSIPDTKTTPHTETVNPDLSTMKAGPHGYHVRVTVVTTDSKGVSDSKSKVIWVQGPCAGDNPEGPHSSFIVHKTVVGGQPNAGPFDFSVDCGETTATPALIELADGEETTVTVAAEAGAECQVDETGTGGAASTTWAFDGGTAATGTTASVVSGDTAEPPVVEFTNSFASDERGSATLRIRKTVVGNGTGPFTFSIDCGNSTLSTSTVSLNGGDSADVAISAPPNGDCSVTETGTGNAASTTWAVGSGTATSGTVATATVAVNQTTTVTFTNTFPGSICSDCGPIIIPGSEPTPSETPPLVVTPAPVEAPAPVVDATTEERPAPPAPQAQAPTAVQGVQLARTGVDTKPLLMAAGLCLLLGGLALLAGRKEQVATPTR